MNSQMWHLTHKQGHTTVISIKLSHQPNLVNPSSKCLIKIKTHLTHIKHTNHKILHLTWLWTTWSIFNHKNTSKSQSYSLPSKYLTYIKNRPVPFQTHSQQIFSLHIILKDMPLISSTTSHLCQDSKSFSKTPHQPQNRHITVTLSCMTYTNWNTK